MDQMVASFCQYTLWKCVTAAEFNDNVSVMCLKIYPVNNAEIIFCRKNDLLTFNTGAAEICANVKKNAEH